MEQILFGCSSFEQLLIWASLQWCQIENQQSPAYVVNSHFLRRPDVLRVLSQLSPFGSESFLMRYCMTLYLKGYQKYDSWKFSFYQVNLGVLTLTCRIFEAPLGKGSYSTQMESSQIWKIWFKRTKLWQHSQHPSRRLEKWEFIT